jgi:hypothetical protein
VVIEVELSPRCELLTWWRLVVAKSQE